MSSVTVPTWEDRLTTFLAFGPAGERASCFQRARPRQRGACGVESTMDEHRRSAAALYVAALGVALFATGCAGSSPLGGPGDQEGEDVVAEIPAGGAAVAIAPIEGAASQTSSHLATERLVIRDAQAWQTFWQGIVAGVSPQPAVPEIDFERHMVIAAAMGQRTSGGYDIAIETAYMLDGALYAVVKSTSPGPTCGAAAVMTAPVVAMITDRFDGPVQFVEMAVTRNCG